LTKGARSMIDPKEIDIAEDAFTIDAVHVLTLHDIRVQLLDDARPLDRRVLADALGEVLENCKRLS
jgi:hypothetical protein